MPIGIRTENLKKIYTSPPPAAAPARGVGFIVQRGAKARSKLAFEVIALDDLSLDIRPGEIFGLLGPNGAGKSTTVGILTTRIRPTSGRAWIGDQDVWKNLVEVKRLIGMVPQRPNLDFGLTAREILIFHGGFLLRLQFGLAPDEFLENLGRLQGVTEVRPAGDGTVHVYADRGGSLIPEVVNLAIQKGVTIRDVHISEPSLENLFLRHTGRSLRE